MKIVIVSDTHGSRKNIENVCECNPDADMLIHLGDVEDDADYIEAILSVQRILWVETMISFQDFRGRKNLNWKDIISYYAWTCILCQHGRGAFAGRSAPQRCGYCDVWAHTCAGTYNRR